MPGSFIFLHPVLFLLFYVAPLCADALSVVIFSHRSFLPCTQTQRTAKEKVKILPRSFQPSNTRIRVLLKYGPLGSASDWCSIFPECPHPWALLYLELRPKSGVEANGERKTPPAACMLCNPGTLFPSNSSPMVNPGKNRS